MIGSERKLIYDKNKFYSRLRRPHGQDCGGGMVSASEKLRTLDAEGLHSWARATLESAALRPAQDGAWYKHAAIKLAEKSLAVADALPQIVAMVEAADEHCLCFGIGTITMMDGSRQPCQVHAALAALDEALK